MFRSKDRSARNLKKGIDKDESRHKRANVSIALRKKARDEQVMKRRNKVEAPVPNENSNVANIPQGSNTKLTPSDVQERMKNLPLLVQAIHDNDGTRQLEAVTEFRKLLSIEKNPPIQQVIDTGVVPRLVQMLTFQHNMTLQFEAAWTLTNIASGTTAHTEHVIKHGAIEMFIRLLSSPNADVQEQAVWALGNIAGDSPQFRDLVLKNGGVGPLLRVFTNDSKITLIRNATWTLSNLCRGKPQPEFEQIKDIVPMVAQLVQMDDTEVLTDSCWALSYISDDNGPNNRKIQSVIDAGVSARLVQCLGHHTTSVQVPALRCVGNIVTGDDTQTQAVLACNPLPALVGLMSHRKRSIRKEACWTISNITAGNSDQIQLVLAANIIPPLVNMLRDSEFDIQKEAAWAISNATSGGNPEQIRFLVANGCIPALCDLFECQDAKMVMVALEGIENILKIGKKDAEMSGLNKFAEIVEECGGLDDLEELQRHENEEIYKKCVKIIQEYFESEEDGEDNMPGVDTNTNTFAFGAPNVGANTTFSF